jgi:hypothetical protein
LIKLLTAGIATPPVLANVRFAPIAAIQGKAVLTDTVENVENRAAPKISRKLILSRLDRRTLLCMMRRSVAVFA